MNFQKIVFLLLAVSSFGFAQKIHAQTQAGAVAGEVQEAKGPSEEQKNKKLEWSGDFRLRQEFFRQAGDENAAGLPNRGRLRARVRLAVKHELSSRLMAKVRLATEGENDATSTNQTLTKGFTTKSFNLDQAYLQWTPAFFQEKTEIFGGKMANPIEASALNWDSDVNPEGMAVWLRPNKKLGFGFHYFALGETSSRTPDTYLTVTQGVWKFKAHRWEGKFAAGWTFVPFFRLLTTGGQALPNNPIQQGNLLPPAAQPNFEVADVLLSLKRQVGKKPLAVKLHVAENQNTFDPADPAQEAKARAYLAEASFGKIEKPGDFTMDLRWAYLEPNAVLASFADSDSQYTNRKYLRGAFGVGLDKNLVLDLTGFAIRRVDHSVLASPESGKTLYRFQVDTSVKI